MAYGAKFAGNWTPNDLSGVGMTNAELVDIGARTPPGEVINVNPAGKVVSVGNVNSQLGYGGATQVPVNPRNAAMTTPNPAQQVMVQPNPRLLPAVRNTGVQVIPPGAAPTAASNLPATTGGGVRTIRPGAVDPMVSGAKAVGQKVGILKRGLGVLSHPLVTAATALYPLAAATGEQAQESGLGYSPQQVRQGVKLDANGLPIFSAPEGMDRSTLGFSASDPITGKRVQTFTPKMPTPAGAAPSEADLRAQWIRDEQDTSMPTNNYPLTPLKADGTITADGKTATTYTTGDRSGAIFSDKTASFIPMADQRAAQLERLGALGAQISPTGEVDDSTTEAGARRFAVRQKLGYVPADYDQNAAAYDLAILQNTGRENVANITGGYGVKAAQVGKTLDPSQVMLNTRHAELLQKQAEGTLSKKEQIELTAAGKKEERLAAAEGHILASNGPSDIQKQTAIAMLRTAPDEEFVPATEFKPAKGALWLKTPAVEAKAGYNRKKGAGVEGTVIQNAKGERMVLRNGAWVAA